MLRDSIDVDCEICREALSALIDGETTPVPADRVEHHLAGCAPCQSWEHQARELSRTLRVRPVERTPDLVQSVVTLAASRRGGEPRRWPRALLACVAVCQIALGVSQLLGLHHTLGQTHPGGALTAGHLFNESTAWNIALGLGLLWCALRVRASAGLVPVLSAFLVVLTCFSIVDFVNAAVSVGRLASHGLLVLGLVFLLMVHREGRRRPQPGNLQTFGDDVLIGGTNHREHEPVDGACNDDRRYFPPTAFRAS